MNAFYIFMSLFFSILVSLITTKVLIYFVSRFEIVDEPSPRKIHSYPTPLLGGIAIFFSFFIVLTFLKHLNPDLSYLLTRQKFFGFFLGSSIILLLGIFDDLYGATARLKFLVQFIAASIAFYYGFRISFITNPLGGVLEFDEFSTFLITVFWIIGLTNAINLLDGLDGLATGVVAIASVSLFVVALQRNDVLSVYLTITLFGSAVGFLFFNLYPAKIFLGDTGSLFLGFLVALLSIVSLNKSVTAISLLVPIAALSIPIYDTLLAIIRRTREKRNIFRADKGHIHHRLLKIGIGHRWAVLVLYFISIYFGVLAILSVYIPDNYSILLFLVFVISCVLAMWILNKVELKLLKKK